MLENCYIIYAMKHTNTTATATAPKLSYRIYSRESSLEAVTNYLQHLNGSTPAEAKADGIEYIDIYVEALRSGKIVGEASVSLVPVIDDDTSHIGDIIGDLVKTASTIEP